MPKILDIIYKLGCVTEIAKNYRNLPIIKLVNVSKTVRFLIMMSVCAILNILNLIMNVLINVLKSIILIKELGFAYNVIIFV